MNAFDSSAKQIDVEHYFRLIARHKWFVVTPAVIGLIVMGVLSLFMKDIYSAKATVLVEQASLPTDFVKSTLPGGPETYVRSLVEQIKSTSRLEQVITDFNLYPERRRRQPIEEVVGFMREQISIESRANDTFSVAFSGEDPVTVQKVTNRLTDMFIEENVRFRLARSAQNVALMEREAQKLRAQVQEQEKRIQEFKSNNLSSLPEQGTANQVQLSATQSRLQSLSDALSVANARLSSARDRIAIFQVEAGPDYDEPSTVRSNDDSIEARLEKSRRELATLQSTLSEKHPDVRMKQKEVAVLQAEAAGRPTRAAPKAPRKHRSPELIRAMDEERTAQADILRYQAEIARLQESMTQMQGRIEQTPRVELELNALSSGLKVLQEQADGYQKKATDAAASLELERQNQGSQFRALDRARVPSRPDSPNRPLLILMGGGVGLVFGLLVIIGLDIVFRPFLDEQDLARFAGVPVLVSIPHLGPFPSDWQRFKRQLNNLLNFLLGASPLAGTNYAPTSLRAPTGNDPANSPPEQSTRLAAKPRGFTYLAGDALEAPEGTPETVAVQTLGGGGAPPLDKTTPIYKGETAPWHDKAHRKPDPLGVPSPANGVAAETGSKQTPAPGGFVRPVPPGAVTGSQTGSTQSATKKSPKTKTVAGPVAATVANGAAQAQNGAANGAASGAANGTAGTGALKPRASSPHTPGPFSDEDGVDLTGALATLSRGAVSPRGFVTGNASAGAPPERTSGDSGAHVPVSSGVEPSASSFRPGPHGSGAGANKLTGAGALPETASQALRKGMQAMVRGPVDASELEGVSSRVAGPVKAEKPKASAPDTASERAQQRGAAGAPSGATPKGKPQPAPSNPTGPGVIVPIVELPNLTPKPVQLLLPPRRTRPTTGLPTLQNTPWGQGAVARIRPEPLFGEQPLLEESLKELGHEAPWLAHDSASLPS